MAIIDYGIAGLATKKGRGNIKNFLFGTPEEHERVSTLRPEQEPLFQQSVNAGLRPGAGGAFGDSADYYRSLLNDENSTYNALAAPELRRFHEQILPGIAEQFAGFGAGGLDSSGFRNAGVNAGTDLAERLGAIRAQLRQQGAQGLTNIGQTGLGNYSQDVMTRPGSEGILSQLGPAVVSAAGGVFGGPIGAAAGNLAGNWLKNSSFGKSSPYGKSENYGVGTTSNLPNPPSMFRRG